jgi:hypothetical protein
MLLRGAMATGVAATAAVAAACSASGQVDLNGSSAPGPEPDAAYPPEGADGGGADGATSGDDGSGEDAASGLDGGYAPDNFVAPVTTVIFLHASPSLPSVRLCWGPDPSRPVALPPFPATNEMPASNYAGIPVGGAAWLTDATGGANMLGGVVYAIRARNIAGGQLAAKGCDELICTPGTSTFCQMLNADYWPLGSLGSLLVGGTNVVAIEGCLGADDPLASPERCGPTWNAATGNLHLEVVQVPSAALDDAGLMVQAAQLSPGLQALVGDASSTSVSFGPQEDAAMPIAQLANEGDLLPSLPTAVALSGGLSTFGQLGFAVDVAGANASAAGHLWMSLAQAQQLVSPAQDPTAYYGAGGTYVVAVLGDPNAPHAFATNADGGYDGRGLHLLLLPTAQTSP